MDFILCFGYKKGYIIYSAVQTSPALVKGSSFRLTAVPILLFYF